MSRRTLPRASFARPQWLMAREHLAPVGIGADKDGRKSVFIGWPLTGRLWIAWGRPGAWPWWDEGFEFPRLFRRGGDG